MSSMKPDYTANDPGGWCGDPRRGAALGRDTIKGDADYSGKLYLSKVRLNSGGYDTNGTYFGVDRPLYWYCDIDNSIDGVLRADSRQEARHEVLAMYPKAKIRR